MIIVKLIERDLIIVKLIEKDLIILKLIKYKVMKYLRTDWWDRWR